MSPELIALISSFVLYAVFVLLPMVPAIKIYQLFPDTKVGISGPLQGLTVKATGAFAAYVVTSLLGFFLIQHIQNQIDNLTQQTWEVRANFEFLDADNMRIEGAALDDLSDVVLQVMPPPYATTKRQAKLLLPDVDERSLERTEVQFSLMGFATRKVKLMDFLGDHSDNKLNLDTITLKANPHAYDHDPEQVFLTPSERGPSPLGENAASLQAASPALTAASPQ